MNIGLVKGRTFPRVLIIPTAPMLEYLKTGDPEQAGDKSRLYVAVTRAKFSAAFLLSEDIVPESRLPMWDSSVG